jgi:hypothetical protein
MRGRAVGLGLIGLGAFALAAALAVRLFLVDALVKLPLDQEAAPVAQGSDISFFDIPEQDQLEGLEAGVSQEVEGDPTAEEAGDDVAVWNFGSVMTATDGTLLNAYTYRVCIDRHTAASVECEAQHVDYERDVTIEGLTLTFPFGTEQRDYELFNPQTRQAWPAVFEGEEEIEGVEVYRFTTTVPETVIRETDVPVAFFGEDGDETVTAEVVYSNVRTVWVEPTSGVIVTAEEHPNTVLRGPDGQEGPTILAGDFTATEQTLADGVERAEDTRGQITWVKTLIPLIAGGLGLVLVVVGVLLVIRANRKAGPGQPLHAHDRPVARAS